MAISPREGTRPSLTEMCGHREHFRTRSQQWEVGGQTWLGEGRPLRSNLLQRHLDIPKRPLRSIDWRGPFRGVGDHPADFRIEIGRVRFVSRPKVEDLARAALVAASAAEYLAPLEPGNEDERLRLRNIEMLAVHLLFFHLDVLADPLDNRMAGRNDPEPLFL